MTNTPDTPDQVDALDEILAPIHDNSFSVEGGCEYETGRWPKPHTCGLPEAKAKLSALLVDELKKIEAMTHEGRGTISWEMDNLCTYVENRIKELQQGALAHAESLTASGKQADNPEEA